MGFPAVLILETGDLTGGGAPKGRHWDSKLLRGKWSGRWTLDLPLPPEGMDHGCHRQKPACPGGQLIAGPLHGFGGVCGKGAD